MCGGRGKRAWLTEPQLLEQLRRVHGDGGRIIYSRDHPDTPPPPRVDAVFQSIVASRPAVEDLVRRGVPLDVVNAQGHTALMLAAYAGHDEEVRLLLAGGADRMIRASSGHSAADMARERQHDEIAALISAERA